MLFYDAGGDGQITEKREYVFTEWDPTARGDLEAIRSVFDSNGDGVLTAADAEFSKFKVEITNADGTTSVQSLTQLGITSINLKGDLTNILYTDGSEITGQTTFTRNVGGVISTGTVANAVLAAEAMGYAIANTSTVDAAGTRTTINVATAGDGSIASSTKTVTTASGASVITSFDDNGDSVYDRVQTKTTATASGIKTETIINRDGGGVLLDSTMTVTQTVAGVKTVTILRDTMGSKDAANDNQMTLTLRVA